MTNEPRRTRLLASGLLVLTFVAGGLVGAASDRLLGAREPDQPTQRTGEHRPDRGRGRGPRSILLEPTVLDQLGVNDEQRKTILGLLAQRDTAFQKIWAEMQPRMDAVWANFEPRFRTMLDASKKEVRQQLTPEQQVKLDSMIQERKDERAKQNQNRNGPEPRSPMDSGKTKTEHFEE